MKQSSAEASCDVRNQIVQIANELYARGLLTVTGGNISGRCEDDPTQIWITPAGRFKGELQPGMMVVSTCRAASWLKQLTTRPASGGCIAPFIVPGSTSRRWFILTHRRLPSWQ